MSEPTRFRRTGDQEMPSCDLMRECGRKLTDRALWELFQNRFHKLIVTYVMRALRTQAPGETAELVHDLTQDVYLRLVRNDGRMMRAFKGTTDFSLMAFLARVAVTAVTDNRRYHKTEKRHMAQVISIEEAREASTSLPGEAAELDLGAIVSWIDVERLVESDADRKHAARNVLIFKLHFIDGFSAPEIAEFPGFDLSEAGINTVLHRLKARVQKGIGNI